MTIFHGSLKVIAHSCALKTKHIILGKYINKQLTTRLASVARLYSKEGIGGGQKTWTVGI